jgi:hypothetical protein
MSVMDELHRLADEAGVEWYEASDITFLGRSEYDTKYAVKEDEECGLEVDPLTPEQVISIVARQVTK